MSCDEATTHGVALAQQGQLDAAERILAAAIDCPAAARELAGIRVLQQRWPEAEDLASAAIAAGDAGDYTWQLLATSRFVQNNPLGALAAWNRAGQPRLDLVRVDGLTRTRHRVVERALGVEVGSLVTPTAFARARRRLAELPSAQSSRLDYAPLPGGIAELRAGIVERPVWPFGRFSLLATGLRAAATRELRFATGSFTGGGERLSIGWRFWPDREGVDTALDAPAPWGGLWGVRASAERQPFNIATMAPAERRTAFIEVGAWASGHMRWTATAGVDRWRSEGARGRIGMRAAIARLDDLVMLGLATDIWVGGSGFAVASGDIRVRSTANRRGFVMLGSAAGHLASRRTPLDVWPAGDTGHARQTMLRAHPLLDGSRLRVDRLGRRLVHTSVEGSTGDRSSGPSRLPGPCSRIWRERPDATRAHPLAISTWAQVCVSR